MMRPHPRSTLFPTRRSSDLTGQRDSILDRHWRDGRDVGGGECDRGGWTPTGAAGPSTRGTGAAASRGAATGRSTSGGTALLGRAAATVALRAWGGASRVLGARGGERKQRETDGNRAERRGGRSHSTISEPEASSPSAGAGSADRARAPGPPKRGRDRTSRALRCSA